jgi:hypothetical protein
MSKATAPLKNLDKLRQGFGADKAKVPVPETRIPNALNKALSNDPEPQAKQKTAKKAAPIITEPKIAPEDQAQLGIKTDKNTKKRLLLLAGRDDKIYHEILVEALDLYEAKNGKLKI